MAWRHWRAWWPLPRPRVHNPMPVRIDARKNKRKMMMNITANEGRPACASSFARTSTVAGALLTTAVDSNVAAPQRRLACLGLRLCVIGRDRRRFRFAFQDFLLLANRRRNDSNWRR